MSDNTKIEWTDATWNPVTGVTLHPERLDQPMRWRRPRRVFVNSLSDLFHDDVPDDYIARVFAVMGTCADHTFQVLTKRPARMRALLNSAEFREDVADYHVFYFRLSPSRAQHWPGTWPLPNVWAGVTVENQQWADNRILLLLGTPAAVRFLSCEPLLGAVSLCRCFPASGPVNDPSRRMHPQLCGLHGPDRIDWVICGGESGKDARPMHPNWARYLRDQCVDAGVPFFFKQWGEYVDAQDGASWEKEPTISVAPGTNHGSTAVMWRVGKKAAGRVLDGRTWNEYPAGAQ